MNKGEFIKAWSEATNLTQKDLNMAFDAAYKILVDTLNTGDKVQFPGFVTICTKVKEGGTKFNQLTKQEVEVETKVVPQAKFGKTFKDDVNVKNS